MRGVHYYSEDSKGISLLLDKALPNERAYFQALARVGRNEPCDRFATDVDNKFDSEAEKALRARLAQAII